MGLNECSAYVMKNGVLVPHNEFIRRGSEIVQSQFYVRRNNLGYLFHDHFENLTDKNWNVMYGEFMCENSWLNTISNQSIMETSFINNDVSDIMMEFMVDSSMINDPSTSTVSEVTLYDKQGNFCYSAYIQGQYSYLNFVILINGATLHYQIPYKTFKGKLGIEIKKGNTLPNYNGTVTMYVNDIAVKTFDVYIKKYRLPSNIRITMTAYGNVTNKIDYVTVKEAKPNKNYLKLGINILEGDYNTFNTSVNANVDVDWGDGVKEHLNCRITDSGTSGGGVFAHTYKDTGRYTITATSDDWSGGMWLSDETIESIEMNLTMKTHPTYMASRGVQIWALERLRSINFMDSEFEFNSDYDHFRITRNGEKSGKYSISNVKKAMFNMQRNYGRFVVANNASDIELPSVMFGETNYTDWSDVFCNNPNLKSIPSTIFGNAQVLKATATFINNTSMVSAPKIWEMYPDITDRNARMCYRWCTSLPWYDEIPTECK